MDKGGGKNDLEVPELIFLSDMEDMVTFPPVYL
jgi:hypothetical protein